jgi:hypothetical protein
MTFKKEGFPFIVLYFILRSGACLRNDREVAFVSDEN